MNALNFDGNNDLVSFGSPATYKGLANFSFACWIKIDDITKDNDILAWGGHSTTNPILFWRDDVVAGGSQLGNTNTVSCVIYDGTHFAYTSAPTDSYNDTNWHFVAFTFQGSNATGLKIYIDGVNSTSASTATVETIAATIGANLWMGYPLNGSAAVAFDGKIRTARMFNKTLSQAEITALFKDQVDRTNLIGEWLMAEGSGTTIEDTSTNNNTGTLGDGTEGYRPAWYTVPEAIFNNGTQNQALSFDGVDDYVDISDSNSLDVGNVLTISAWIKTNDLTGRHNIYSASNNNTTGALWMEIGSASGVYTNGLTMAVNGTYVIATAGNVLTTSIWHLVTYTRTGTGAGTHAIYIDGTSVSLVTDGGVNYIPSTNYSDNAVGKLIGMRNSSTKTQGFNGLIDDVRIYSRALSATEVLSLYKGQPVSSTGLVGHWSFNGVATDDSGYGNNGTVYGAVYQNIQPRLSSSGTQNQAILLDGTDDYILTTINSSEITTAFSVSVRFKASAWGTAASIATRLITAWQSASSSRWTLGCNTLGTLGTLTATGSTLSLNRWYHAVLIYNGSNTKVYLDGVIDINVNGSYTGTYNDVVRIGCYDETQATAELKRIWNGKIDSVKIWTRVLTEAEAIADYKGQAVSTTSLLGQYEFNGDATDSSGQGNDATGYGTSYQNVPLRITF